MWIASESMQNLAIMPTGPFLHSQVKKKGWKQNKRTGFEVNTTPSTFSALLYQLQHNKKLSGAAAYVFVL